MLSTERPAVRSSLLRTKTSISDSPLRASPPRQMSPFSAGISSPKWHGRTSPPLGLTISLSSHAPPSPRKARSFTKFRKADWKGYTAELERKFAETPLPTSCLQADHRRCRKTPHIPSGYVRDYSGLLPEVVRPLISERDQRRTEDPLDPAIKLLDRDIQQLISQDAQDQWRSLLESSDRATNPGPYCASWEVRGWTSHLTSRSPSMEKPTPARRRSHEPSTGSSPPAQPNKTGHSPFPARLQTGAFHRLGPAPHLC